MKLKTRNKNLINILGIRRLPMVAKAELLEGVSEVIEWRILAAIFRSLGEENGQKLLELLAHSGSEEDISQLITEHVDDIEAIIIHEGEAYKDEMQELAEDINGALHGSSE